MVDALLMTSFPSSTKKLVCTFLLPKYMYSLDPKIAAYESNLSYQVSGRSWCPLALISTRAAQLHPRTLEQTPNFIYRCSSSLIRFSSLFRVLLVFDKDQQCVVVAHKPVLTAAGV